MVLCLGITLLYFTYESVQTADSSHAQTKNIPSLSSLVLLVLRLFSVRLYFGFKYRKWRCMILVVYCNANLPNSMGAESFLRS